jgi:zinc transport system permease protein
MPEPFLLRALLAGLGLALVAAPLGCFVVWRRMAYFGETISQGGLLGVALGLLLNVDPTSSMLAVTVALSLLMLVLARQQIVPFDSLLGLMAHTALAIGAIASMQVAGSQVNLTSYLFGDIFVVSPSELRWVYIGGALALGVLFWIWRPLLAISVHEDLAAAEGVPVERIKLIFVLLLAFIVAISMKIVGILLAIAFLIMPAAAARPFAETPEQMATMASIFAMLAVAVGFFISLTLDTPGGPSVVLVLAALFIASMIPVALRSRN